MFPTVNSVGKLPPRDLFTGRKIDFDKECRVAFGQYVEVNMDQSVTNNMTSRTIKAIA